MKRILQSKILWATALLLSLGIAGCNIFNPTESININDDDAEALTYEGYKHIREWHRPLPQTRTTPRHGSA